MKRGLLVWAAAVVTAVSLPGAQTQQPAPAQAPAAQPAAKPPAAAAAKSAATVKPAAKPPAAPAAKPAATVKPAAPAAKAAAPAKAAWTLESVIKLLKGGMSEDFVIGQVKQRQTAFSLTPEDMIAIKQAGGTERLITTMIDPASTPAPAAAAPAAAAPASAPAPVAQPAAAAPAPAAAPIAVAATPATPPAPRKRKIAVYEFDYSTVRTAVQQVFRTDQNIGRGIQSLLVDRMTKMGDFTMLERGKIDTVMKEQDFGASGRVKQGTQARIGRITGADAQVFGDIVVFGRDDKKKSIRGGGLIGGVVGGAMKAFSEEKAVVAITFRVVDAETSELLYTEEARGESMRKSKSWGGFLGGIAGAAVGLQVDMKSDNFAQTIIGEATIDCVTKLAEKLKANAAKVPQKQLAIEGRVADVSGAMLTVTVGSNDGVQVGDRLEVHQVLKEITDPTTKEVLDLQTVKIGDMVVQTVRDRIAIGAYTGNPGVAVNFLVRKPI